MYDNYQETAYETDECLSKGICSISPALSSIQEIIVLYIKELSFYLLKLNNYGISNKVIKETILYAISNIITNIEYNQEQFHDLISNLYDYIFQSKALYEKYCMEHNIEIETTKSYFKYSKKFNLTEAIRKGEKYFLKKSSTLTPKQKNLYDILYLLIKSITIKITELARLSEDYNEAYLMILEMFNAIRPGEISEDEIVQVIKESINVYYQIAKSIYDLHIERYGKMVPAEVPFSIEPGKAILVSGSDLTKLEDVLNAVENTDIGVYTHGFEMLIAHSFPKLKSHPNLKGHYGSDIESSVVDFATFPGAILMTKFTIQRIEYLFRGRLFTLDPIPPMGVVKIKDNNYEPLVKSALEAKGFVHPIKKQSMKIGFDEPQLKEKLTPILDKLTAGEIKSLYIIGLVNYQNIYKQYFDQFFKSLPSDSFAISLNYDIVKKNVLRLDSFYDYSLFYGILKMIDNYKPLKELNITVYLTKCNKHTLPNLLYLKEAGIRNVYACKCPPYIINPSLMDTLTKVFGIKEFSNPKTDIKDTLENWE